MHQSEKHLMHLDNPSLDINNVSIHRDRLAEMKLEYMPNLPPVATKQQEASIWNPIQDQSALKGITDMKLAESTDRKILNLDLKDQKARLKVVQKLIDEKTKVVVLFDRQTQSRMHATHRGGA